MKRCSACGKEFPRTAEYFNRLAASKDGLNSNCNSCTRARSKEYYKNNKEKRLKYAREYRENNREKTREAVRKHYWNNRESVLEYNQKYKEENRERIRKSRRLHYKDNKDKYRGYNKKFREENPEYSSEYNKRYLKENREKVYERNRNYRRRNPDKVRLWNQRRKARKEMLPHTLTEDEWEQTLEAFEYSCAYCGHKPSEEEPRLHQDHFIPVTFGGGYTAENIIPACASCNSSKHSNGFFEWYPSYGYYDPEREAMIAEYLGYDL